VNFFYAGSSYNLFLDGGNGRVGMSTSSPNSKLHVVTGGASSGYAGADRGILVTDINGARLILEHSGATSGSKNYVLRSESGIFSLALLNDAGTAWTADHIINANSSGNVGIGTAFPSAKLHVDGSIYTNGNTTIDAALTISGSPAINLTGSGTGTYNKTVIYNDQTYGFLLEGTKASDSSGAAKKPIQLTWRGGYSNNGGLVLEGSTKLYTNNTGLGIGTTSPQTYLDIVGNNSGSKSINSRAGNSNNGNSSAHLIMSWNGNPYNSNGYAHSIRTKHDGGSTSLNTIEFWLWKYGTDSASTLGSLEAMRIQGDGKLQVANDIIAFSTTVSDARLKDEVVTIDNALDKVKALRGVEYVWNKGGREGQKDLGFIAQEVEQVIPEIVRENEMPLMDDSGETYKTVDYEKVVAVLVEAIKEQQKQIDELKARLDA
jgi:hypothetical protein